MNLTTAETSAPRFAESRVALMAHDFPSVNEIAAKAGLSEATVSRVVVGGFYPVAPATVDRVKAAVDALGGDSSAIPDRGPSPHKVAAEAGMTKTVVERILYGKRGTVKADQRARVAAAVEALGGDPETIPPRPGRPRSETRAPSGRRRTDVARYAWNNRRLRGNRGLLALLSLAGMDEADGARWVDDHHPHPRMSFVRLGLIKLISEAENADRLAALEAHARSVADPVELDGFDNPPAVFHPVCPFCGERWEADAPNTRHGHGCAEELAAKSVPRPEPEPKVFDPVKCPKCVMEDAAGVLPDDGSVWFTPTHHLHKFCGRHRSRK